MTKINAIWVRATDRLPDGDLKATTKTYGREVYCVVRSYPGVGN